MKKARSVKPHPHIVTGDPCYCGWRKGTLAKTADWDEIRGRKRYRSDEAQMVLDGLQSHGLHRYGDKWMPWLLDQIRKGHINPEWATTCEYCGDNYGITSLWLEKGQIPCETCDGDGESTCHECEGDGREDCWGCHNSDIDGKQMADCEECDGTGEIDCKTCDGDPEEEESCPNCTGGKEECPECDGRGIEYHDCEECEGRGDNDCEYCSGTGESECDECYGDGRVACGECDGDGWSPSHMSYQDTIDTLKADEKDPDEEMAATGFIFEHPTGNPRRLHAEKWRHWADWLDSGHPTRQAFNPTHDEFPDLVTGIDKWEADLEAARSKRIRELGEVQHATPEGWTVRELKPDELEDEGDEMGHCVGEYKDDVENGDLRVLSLRDPKGDPHVTTGIRFNETDHGGGQIYQHYGKGNADVKPKYNSILREYFETMPPDERPLAEWEGKGVNSVGTIRQFMKKGGTDELGLSQLPSHVSWGEIIESTMRPTAAGAYRPPTPKMLNDIYGFHQFMRNASPSSTLPFDEWVADRREDYANVTDPSLNRLGLTERYTGDNGEEAVTKYQQLFEDRLKALEAIHAQQPQNTVTASKRYSHLNYYTGEPCNCGFGRPAPKPDWEFTAAKIDWLRKREDLQFPEAQEFLDNLEKRYPSADKLYPKIVQHWKQNRKFQLNWDRLSEEHPSDAYNLRGIQYVPQSLTRDDLHPHQEELRDQWHNFKTTPDGRRLTVHGNGSLLMHEVSPSGVEGVGAPISCGQLDEIISNMEKLKAHGRGVNLDSFTLPQFLEHMENEGKWLDAHERRNLGQPVHQFDNGWSIKRLQNAHECIKEGKDMHHCTGNPTQPEPGHSHYKGMSYQEGVHPDPDESKYHLFSLRDENNFPHATFETAYPLSSDVGNEVVQLYGPHDQPGPEEHRDMVNEFLGQHGVPSADWGTNPAYGGQCENCGDDEIYEDDLCRDCWENSQSCANCGSDYVYQDRLCEDCWDKANFEPWWEDEYFTEPADDVHSYIDQFHNGETSQYADPEWERAWGDADTYEHEPPDLIASEPDFESVWSDLANPHHQFGSTPWQYEDPLNKVPKNDGQLQIDRGQNGTWDEFKTQGPRHRNFDPEEHQEFLEIVKDEGHLQDFYHAYYDWLKNEYEGAPEWPYEDEVANFYGNAFQEHINPETGAFENPKRVWKRRDPNDPDSGQKSVWETARDRYWQRQAPNYPQIEGLEQADTFNEGYYNSEPQQVPARPSYWSKTAKRKTHYHWEHGHPCGCPWGEHQGWTAARIDNLKGRPDLQTEDAQTFLKRLEEHGYPDKLLNWIVREWKADRLHMRKSDQYGRLIPENSSGRTGPGMITPESANEWVKTLDEAKRLGNGIDLMQHDYSQLYERMQKEKQAQIERDWPNLGQVVHKFDDGWTMRKLRNAREAQIEGDKEQMNHCVGGYGRLIEDGHYHVYSLRDPDNNPHVTVQLNDDHPEATGVSQAYAKGDTPITNEEHANKVKDWLDKLPGVSGNHLESWTRPIDDEEEQFVPWWNPVETLDIDHPDTYIYMHHPTGGNPEIWNTLPDEYRHAVYEAEEHGVQPPDLEPGNIDWHSILGSMVDGDIAKAGEQYGLQVSEEMFEALKRHPQDFQEFYNTWNQWKNGEQIRTGPHRFSPIAQPYDERDAYHRSLNNYWQQAFGQAYNPETGDFRPPTFTPGKTWWDDNYQNYPQLPSYPGFDWQEPENQITQRFPADHRTNQPIPSYMRMGAAPMYYRWTFSPDTGEVEVGHNDEDHPALVRYHNQLADKIDRAHVVNGYAYRISDGWRLSDDEHRPLEDPYVVSQVLRALNQGDRPVGPTWTAEHEDFDRLHYGLPSQAD